MASYSKRRDRVRREARNRRKQRERKRPLRFEFLETRDLLRRSIFPQSIRLLLSSTEIRVRFR